MIAGDEYGGEKYRPDAASGADADDIGWLESGSEGDSVDADSDPAADPEVLRADIAETRDRMSDTLGEIGERLNPHRVTEQVKDSIREATIGRVENMAQQAAGKMNETKRGIVDAVRENPLPAAMVALGLGWMILNGRGGSGAQTSGYREATGNLRDANDWRYGQESGYGYDRGDTNVDSDGIVDTLRSKAGAVRDSVTGSASGLADRAQSMAGSVAQNTRMGTRTVEDAFFGNPLLTGVITVALGLATGLAAPVTHPEVALMGGARDQLGDSMRDLVDDTKHKAEHVAGRVIDTAKSAARDEGLVAGQ